MQPSPTPLTNNSSYEELPPLYYSQLHPTILCCIFYASILQIPIFTPVFARSSMFPPFHYRAFLRGVEKNERTSNNSDRYTQMRIESRCLVRAWLSRDHSTVLE